MQSITTLRQGVLPRATATASRSTAAAAASTPTPLQPARQRRRRSRSQWQLPDLVPLQPQHSAGSILLPVGPEAAGQHVRQQGGRMLLIPLGPQQAAEVATQQQLQQQQLGGEPMGRSPGAATGQQQQQAAHAAAVATGHADSGGAAQKPSWARAVDKRVAALPDTVTSTRVHTRSARNVRWRRPASAAAAAAPALPARAAAAAAAAAPANTQASRRAEGSTGSSREEQVAGLQGVLATSSIEEYLETGQLSAEGEQQLCWAYQRYLQLQQVRAQPREAQQLMQATTAEEQEDREALAALLQHPDTIQQEGLLAQELLLQMYEPLLINRAKRVQSRHVDLRELLAAARQGLLRAAARFDAQRVAGGRGGGARLYALAERYIKNALRDVLTEYQTAVVHVPVNVRELAAKLHRVHQQLRRKQQGQEPTLAQLAAAAGVTLKHAQQALQATGGALQAVSLQSSVSKEKEERGKGGTGVDMQQVDVSMEEDSQELSGVVGAGGLAAARSGLAEELDAAAGRAVLDQVLGGLMARLSPQDRQLLQLKLEGGDISRAARELGKSRQWGSAAVDKVVKQLREGVKKQAQHDAELAALLRQ